jgi:hypothetical protein
VHGRDGPGTEEESFMIEAHRRALRILRMVGCHIVVV